MLHCMDCGRNFSEKELLWRCPCGGILDLDGWPFAYAPREDLPGLWRYASSLPVERPEAAASMGEGMTPLVRRDWQEKSGRASIHFKFDALCPTGSYKDRGMAVLTNRLRELGITQVVEDSSGNAGAAMAAYCALTGISCDIYVPDYTSEGKCVQIASYGAKLVRVPGSREDTTRAAEAAAASVYYASHNWSPYFAHGVKTYAFEVYEQLGKAPDVVVVPVGQGSLALGAYLGFSELLKAGKIDRLPRIFGVQSEACAPLFQAWRKGESTPAVIIKGETMAEGIASSEPVRGAETIRLVRESGGGFVVVSEKAIWAAFERLAGSGLYVEPTSACVAAGVSQLLTEGWIKPDACCVALLSGSGLKATDKIMHLREEPPV